MQNTDVFIPLAEIAGVFVGFGALIAVRSGATMALSETIWMRYVARRDVRRRRPTGRR